MATVPLMAVTWYQGCRAGALQLWGADGASSCARGTPWFQELVQGFRPIINLMAVQLSCDGLELQSAPSLPWNMFRARGAGKGRILKGLFQSL